MTAVARPAPATRRAPARTVDRRRQRSLRVVDTTRVQAARRARRMVAALSLVVATGLVVAVMFHVALAQGQLELDRLRGEVAEEQERYERLRVEVAAASSPEEIVRRAEALGLVTPDEVTYVSPLPGTPEVATELPETSPSTMGNWATVKPHLVDP